MQLIHIGLLVYLAATVLLFGHSGTWTRELAYRTMPTQAHQSIMLANTIPLTIQYHVVFGAIWMGLVTPYRRLHAYIGYAYVAASTICAVTAPAVARAFNHDARLETAALCTSALAMLFLVLSIVCIRQHNVIGHVRWMRMNMALGMGSVLMRPMLVMYGLAWSLEPQCVYNDAFLRVAVASFGGCFLLSMMSIYS